MKPRWLVVGASGLVGRALVVQAQQAGAQVLGAARHLRGQATFTLDITNPAAVRDAVAQYKPDVVAVCSAFSHVDGCEREPQRSYAENVETVRNVIRATAASNARVLFFSTDQVFDGKQASPKESDPVHPLNVYARHKREAETFLLETGRALIARTAWVFGVEDQRKNFVYRVIESARQKSPLRLPRGQSGCPTWADWLASRSVELLGRGEKGVLHLSGRRLLSKAEWARLIAERLGLFVDIIETPWEESGQIAPRPASMALDTERHSFEQPELESILDALRASLLG